MSCIWASFETGFSKQFDIKQWIEERESLEKFTSEHIAEDARDLFSQLKCHYRYKICDSDLTMRNDSELCVLDRIVCEKGKLPDVIPTYDQDDPTLYGAKQTGWRLSWKQSESKQDPTPSGREFVHGTVLKKWEKRIMHDLARSIAWGIPPWSRSLMSPQNISEIANDEKAFQLLRSWWRNLDQRKFVQIHVSEQEYAQIVSEYAQQSRTDVMSHIQQGGAWAQSNMSTSVREDDRKDFEW